MFDKINERFMTKNVAKELYPEIAALLWNLIDSSKAMSIKLDYLQTFGLYESNGK